MVAVDQPVEKYTCPRKTARWNFNVFMYLIDIIINANRQLTVSNGFN